MFKANVLAAGTYKELQASNLDFTKLLKYSVGKAIIPDNTLNIRNENDNDMDPNSIFDRRVSAISFESVGDNKVSADEMEPVETRSFGKMSHSVYTSYLLAGGKFWKILFFIFICVLSQIVASIGDLWITYWFDIILNQ